MKYKKDCKKEPFNNENVRLSRILQVLLMGVLAVALFSQQVLAGDVIAKAGNFYVDGKLGVGTSSPGWAKVDIHNDGFYQLRLTDSADASYSLRLGTDSSSGYSKIQSEDLGVAYTNLALNPSGGNVGIGTTAPGSELEIRASSPELRIFSTGGTEDMSMFMTRYYNPNFGFKLWLDNNAGDTYFDSIWDHNNADLFFRNHVSGTPVTLMTLKGNGNVGIGTTSPKGKLQVVGDLNVTGDIYYDGSLISYSPLMLQDTICLKDKVTGEWVECGSYNYTFQCSPSAYCEKKAAVLVDRRTNPKKYLDCYTIQTDEEEGTVCEPVSITEGNIDELYNNIGK